MAYTKIVIVFLFIMFFKFYALALEYDMTEELPKGTFIADLYQDAKLENSFPQDKLNSLKFSFFKKPGVSEQYDPANYFEIGVDTGVLRTSSTLDRDLICPLQDNCIIEMDIAVAPVEFLQVIYVKINVIDINDNAPVFPKNSTTLFLSESVSIGTKFGLTPADDLDSRKNSLKEYKLIDGSHKFDIEQNIGPGNLNELSLVIKSTLDRETVSHYKLKIIATDNGVLPLSGTLIVHVEVLDTNDNSPKFEQDTYKLSISEDTAVNTNIVKIKATDTDEGDNGIVRYHIEEKYTKQFGIRNETGDVYLKLPLHYEETSLYHVIVTAYDLGEARQTSRATIIIDVLDVNDNAPIVAVNTLSSDGTPKIREHSPKDTFIAHISASDIDSGPGGQVTCSLVDYSNAFELKHLHGAQYKLVSAIVFDREFIKSVDIIVNCIDSGTPALNMELPLIVKIVDINDHHPKFVKDSYTFSITENNYVGFILSQINATDKDKGINKEIRYSLEGKDKDYFFIDSINGVLKAAYTFDFETKSSFQFIIVAEDMGIPPLRASTEIYVNVIDENDNPPVFSRNSYVFEIPENNAFETEIGFLQATDIDSASFGHIQYMLEDSKMAKKFKINKNTGIIQAADVYDREKQSIYHIIALAFNTDNPNLSSSVGITIHINDINDNAPSVRFPSDNLTFTIYSDVEVDFLVTKIIATDADEKENARIKYIITKGNEEGLFGVEPNSGSVRVMKSISNLSGTVFKLYILVEDFGSPSLSTGLRINVAINESLYILDWRGSDEENSANKTVIIAIVSTCLFIIIILIITIIIIKFNDSRRKRRHAENNRPHQSHADQQHTMVNNRYNSADISFQNTTAMSEKDLKCQDILNLSMQLSPGGDKIIGNNNIPPRAPLHQFNNQRMTIGRSESPLSLGSFGKSSIELQKQKNYALVPPQCNPNYQPRTSTPPMISNSSDSLYSSHRKLQKRTHSEMDSTNSNNLLNNESQIKPTNNNYSQQHNFNRNPLSSNCVQNRLNEPKKTLITPRDHALNIIHPPPLLPRRTAPKIPDHQNLQMGRIPETDDLESTTSQEGSNADSGKGPSEEDETHYDHMGSGADIFNKPNNYSDERKGILKHPSHNKHIGWYDGYNHQHRNFDPLENAEMMQSMNSTNEMADDVTTTSGSYVVDLNDLKDELEAIGESLDNTVC